METTLTSGQLQTTLNLLKQQRMTPERYQLLCESGVLADIYGLEWEKVCPHSLRVAIQLAINLCLRQKAEIAPSSPALPSESLLKRLGQLTVGPTSGQFCAVDWFKPNDGKNSLSKFFDFGLDFTKWFLKNGGKIEEPIGEQVLGYHHLLLDSFHAPIIAELGGEAKAEICLTEIFELVKLQKNGESGVLLNNGAWNIFSVRGQNGGVLRAVGVGWDGDGWYVNASPVGAPNRWRAGDRVFSRKAGVERSVA